MATIAELLSAKLQAEGLSVPVAAKKAGVSLVSFRSVLKGKSRPNARSIDKYADFLGVTKEEIVAGDIASKADKAPQRRRGRPRKTESRPDHAALSSALSTITARLKAADALASDPLVASLSQLSKQQQRASILGLIESFTVTKAPAVVGTTKRTQSPRLKLSDFDKGIPSQAKERAAMVADGAVVGTGSSVAALREDGQ